MNGPQPLFHPQFHFQQKETCSLALEMNVESFERLIWQIPNRQSIQDERILYSIYVSVYPAEGDNFSPHLASYTDAVQAMATHLYTRCVPWLVLCT